MNTSDAFDDDSFFSESILLSTQALEEEAIGCNPTPSKKMKNESIMTPSSPQTNSSNNFVFNQPSSEGSVTRRSFDLGSEELIQNENLNTFGRFFYFKTFDHQIQHLIKYLYHLIQHHKNLPLQNFLFQINERYLWVLSLKFLITRQHVQSNLLS